MKSFLQISLLVFYLVFNAGLSYSLHFCGEDLAAINLYNAEKTCCPGEKEMPGCCDDVPHLDLQNSKQSLSKIIDCQFTNINLQLQPYPYCPSLRVLFPEITIASFFKHENAPPSIAVPVYIRHQVFLI